MSLPILKSEASARVSACVDCQMTLIGEAMRCPACHERHAHKLVATDLPTFEPAVVVGKDIRVTLLRDVDDSAWAGAIEEDAQTKPHTKPVSLWQGLLTIAQLILLVAFGLWVVAKGCGR